MENARARKSEQCGGFASVSYKRKTARPFFNTGLHQPNPSSAEDLRASPIKEKRAKRFSPLDLKEQIRTVSAWSAKGSMKRKRQNFFDIVPKNYSGYLPHRSFIARLICSRLALSAAFTFCILIAYKIFLCGSIARAAFLSNFRLCLRSSAQ